MNAKVKEFVWKRKRPFKYSLPLNLASYLNCVEALCGHDQCGLRHFHLQRDSSWNQTQGWRCPWSEVSLWLEPVGLSVGGSPSQGAGCMSWKHLEQAPVWVRTAVGAQVTAHGSGTTCRGDNLLCVLQTTCVESVTASFNKHISVLCREVFSYSLGKLKTRERYFSWIIWGAYLHSVFTII